MSREDEYAYAAQALPTPTDTPYRTPARSLSRRSSRHSSRHCNSSPGPSSSPPPFPPGGDSYFRNHGGSKDFANDETISILDPRRFTPTLHASLVSEILSLRRDQESKTSLIENLESSLHTARLENDSITETLTSTVKDARTLERQLQALEGGSSSAFGELAKERDEALTSVSDVRQRLEISQAKIRSQEEEADRTHALWDRDRQTWEGERRNLERKVHVVEGRLRTVLAEIAAAQADELYRGGDPEAEEAVENRGFGGEGDRTSVRAHSALDRRPMSSMSNSTRNSDAHNTRLSMLSGPNGYGGMKAGGLTLADELGFDEEEEDLLEDSELDDGRISPDALPEERQGRMSSLSLNREHQKARKVLGLPLEQESTVAKVMEPSYTEKVGIFDGSEEFSAVLELRYTDTGIQYSPPPSPGRKSQPQEMNGYEHNEDRILSSLENGANQSRKRVSVSTVPPVDQYKDLSSAQRSTGMVSSASQTFKALPCPSCIYKEALETVVTSHHQRIGSREMTSSSTQTDEVQGQQTIPLISNPDSSTSDLIPTITIHPPISAPSSPRTSVVLPPHTKSTACQASIVPSVELRSISVQTEEIRIDNRAVKLPENLGSSNISSEPPTPQLSHIEDDGESPISNEAIIRIFRTSLQNPPPERPPPPRPVDSSVEPEEAYPGNNDNGPLDRKNGRPIRRPFRSSSLFAGFDIPSDEEARENAEGALSDDDFRNAAPIRKTLSKIQNSWKFVPLQKEHALESSDIPEVDEEVGTAHDCSETQDTNALHKSQTQSAGWGPSAISQPTTRPLDTPRWGTIAKQPDIRKTALISSGTAVHLQRSRSPSLPSTSSTAPTTAAPPFPVPTRSSSRNIPLSASDGAQSPTPHRGGVFPGDRRREPGWPPSKKPMMRKVRSAAAMSRGGHQGRSRSQSPPPPILASSAVPESPKLPRVPPMPKDGKSSSGHGHAARPYQHEQQVSTSNSDAGNTIVDSSIQQTTVVDAIAQTMVGEWMWKYVRKRKSFGVAESPQADWEMGRNAADGSGSGGGSGIRHKRWVWLAPYERAVMWSSKQPTSGSALLGKSGRKLTIQSVLDVKDDTPYPKGSSPQQHLNRSILILTPQRALKFTATSKERHYIWLTALSFLSHSTLGVHDLDCRPAIPSREYEPPPHPNPGTLRRNPIRDSIRVAKGKARPNTTSARSYTSPASSVRHEWMQGPPSTTPLAAQVETNDAAEPPHVPRFSNHGRKRSNTGPRQHAGPFLRNITNHSAFASNHSLHTSTSADTSHTHPHTHAHTHMHNAPSSFFPAIRNGSSAQSSLSPRTSEASGGTAPAGGVVVNNFFDAVGTVRMEAFVEQRPGAYEGPGQGQGQERRTPARKSHRTREGRKKDLEYWGVGGEFGGGSGSGKGSGGLGNGNGNGNVNGRVYGQRVEEGGDPFMGF